MWCPRESDAFRVAAPSRRRKVDSIDPGHLLQMARQALFHGEWNKSRSRAHVLRALMSASSRGNEEATWLLNVLQKTADSSERIEETAASSVQTADLSKRMGEATVSSERMVETAEQTTFSAQELSQVFSGQNGARAQFYQGWCLACRGDGVCVTQWRESAENGYPPAMSQYGKCLREKEGVVWFQRAAEMGDAEGTCLLGISSVEKDREFELLQLAAQRGHVYSIDRLCRVFRTRLGELETATLGARCVLLSGRRKSTNRAIRAIERRISEWWASESDIRTMHNVGRELEGFDQIWDATQAKAMPEVLFQCIDVYLLVLHRARRAALQTVVALRNCGMPRDVAVLIARQVYRSRDHVIAWFPVPTPPPQPRGSSPGKST